MSLTPGYILTDEYGDMIGLTLAEVGTVLDAHERGPAPDLTIKGSWPRLHIRWIGSGEESEMLIAHVGEYYGMGDTVIVTPADVAEMRAVLAAQQAPDTHPRAAAEERIVSTLAGLMRAKLAQRRHRGDWREAGSHAAISGIVGEYEELQEAVCVVDLYEPSALADIIGEAVDVAASCAILIDVLSAEAE